MARVAAIPFPGPIPHNLVEGYAVQDAAIAALNQPLGGWKIARIPADQTTRLGASFVFGPVPAKTVRTWGGDALAHQAIAGGFCAGEAEIVALVIDPGASSQCSPALAWQDWLIELRAGIEIAGHCCPPARDSGPPGSVADFASNDGLVIGPPLPLGATIAVTSLIDGVVVGEAEVTVGLDRIGPAMVALAEHLAARGHPIRPGMAVATGALTGAHPLAPGSSYTARFGTAAAMSFVVT